MKEKIILTRISFWRFRDIIKVLISELKVETTIKRHDVNEWGQIW